jgi:hypothetical protein
MDNPLPSRRKMMDAARRYLLEGLDRDDREPDTDAPPRLTLNALEKISMSRSRERILGNLDEMYREAQMAALDFAYRREQLYFEILLDIREAIERRG